MELKIGSAVISLAGRDKDRYLVVLKLEGDYAYLADGILRRIENPKKKKLKHLAITKTVFEDEFLMNNKRLKTAIQERFGAQSR